ncbi:S-adenosyl-methyltransferase [Flavobacterium sp. NST-5]|uniref:S-adenosyl-methyltransferase n=1 Tax=Flavobacterium ichthyis TaxID=2698827 RepID=A0ABW9Z9G5_9FLAO|nr:FtsL-like putative cell division protein [Flavobacterium ichthyis]NBL64745.1 S-adenosyl-methyltransferase [Flavobacterium ichthyis]
MKGGMYSILKAKFLINDDAAKNWQFIIFLIFLALLMIANSHNYEQKTYRITELDKEVKELRSEFVDRRSELMKLKMESTISQKMEPKGIFPSSVPPKKIKVVEKKEKNFFEKLWQ